MHASELPATERWIQRLTTATLVAIAVSLVGLGVILYR